MHFHDEALKADPRQINAALRKQLGSISAASQVLLHMAGDECKTYLATINRATFRATWIIYESELAQRIFDEDELQLYLGRVDLSEWCRSATERVAELLEIAGYHFSCSCEKGEIIAEADRELLDDLLYVLISNAAKAAAPEGEIHVSLTVQGKNAVLTVSDKGQGLDSNALDRLLGNARNDLDLSPDTGAGLGLCLAQAIAKAHGGLFVLNTGPDVGTRAVATIPLWTCDSAGFASPKLGCGFDRALTALSDVLPLECYMGG